MHTCIPSHRLKSTWLSCPRRMNAGNKSIPSIHHPRRQSSPKMVNSRDVAEKQAEEAEGWWSVYFRLFVSVYSHLSMCLQFIFWTFFAYMFSYTLLWIDWLCKYPIMCDLVLYLVTCPNFSCVSGSTVFVFMFVFVFKFMRLAGQVFWSVHST